jgi:hypothetical protein
VTEFRSIKIELSSHELRARLEAFKRRASDLAEFMKEQKWGTLTSHVNRSDEHRPRIDGDVPNELALEGLYRRFRFFILNDESANYHRLLRLLSASSKCDEFQQFLKRERRDFLKSDSLDFGFITARAKYRAEEVLQFWFNAYYFHDEEVKREKLAVFEGIVSRRGAKVVLRETVFHGARKVRNMAWLVRDATPANPVVYLPVEKGSPNAST